MSEPTEATSPPPHHPLSSSSSSPSSRPTSSPSSNKFAPLFSTPHRSRPHTRRPRRRSVDSARHRNSNNPSFFEHESTVFVDIDDDDHNVPSTATVTMSKASTDSPRPRRQVLRIDAQDGPWAISVAENPHDPTPTPSYSLYVKTPTHNLTLARTAREIAELHTKLHEAFPNVALPSLPFDPTALPAPKRKSAFLNTLSRLASPARTTKNNVAHFQTSSSHPTPRAEQDDPFSSTEGTPAYEAHHEPDAASPQSPALSAYLTTLANDQLLRTARAWKRFVRVRTDDLESVRVERAIKRVRSDLAAHVAGGNNVSVHVLTEGDGGKRQSRFREEMTGEGAANGHIQEETAETAMPHAQEESEPEPVAESEPEPEPITDLEPESEVASIDVAEAVTAREDDTAPVTPVATEQAVRSRAADPGSSARTTLTRAFAPSSASESSRADTTGDDSSTGPGRRTASHARPSKRKVTVTDFEMMRVLGKGCAGKVLLVRYRKRGELYALKAITKRHVLAHQELQHTLTEQAVLKRMADEGRDPFVVKLHYSFHDKENLFLVMDFHPGGDLATQLARWGRLGRDRARFYAAEIVEGVEGLHAAGVIYRDLKPENILIAHDGHIVLTDFGLSKEFARKAVPSTTAPSTPNGRHASLEGPYWMAEGNGSGEWARGVGNDTTSTFCGTAEYLAPEVIQGLPYSYEVDWWSFGTMLYEMLTGITPFWADNHSDMYVRVLQDELQFPDDRAMDQDTKSLIRGLLQRNPALRIKEPRIKRHPYFSMIDWTHVYYKRYIPPYIPPIDPSNASDTQNFDDTFLDMEPVINDGADDDETDADAGGATDTDRDSATTPSGSRSSSAHPAAVADDDDVDVFDGYSFKGRHSVIIDDGVEEEEEDGDVSRDDGADDEEGADERSILAELNGAAAKAKTQAQEHDGTPEPKTPEARKADLPAAAEKPKPTATQQQQQPKRPSVDTAVSKGDHPAALSPTETLAAAQAAALASNGPDIHRKEIKKLPAKKGRREKSGVPQLDQDLGQSEDEEGDEARTERDEDARDDDWDFIDVDGEGGEDRNGAKGTSLFARGVVDRYKLAVFRKGPQSQAPTPGRSVSGGSAATGASGTESPKERRGRAGLPFRKTPRQFLRPKSPRTSAGAQSTPSVSASVSSKTSTSVNGRQTASGTGTLTSRRSLPNTGTVRGMESASLRSKPSETSFGSPPSSSDASVTEETTMAPHDEAEEDREKQSSASTTGTNGNNKGRKLKKYKEGAEKVLSLFASPR